MEFGRKAAGENGPPFIATRREEKRREKKGREEEAEARRRGRKAIRCDTLRLHHQRGRFASRNDHDRKRLCSYESARSWTGFVLLHVREIVGLNAWALTKKCRGWRRKRRRRDVR